MRPIYLDHNATTRPDDAVVEAMAESLREGWANPSSVHRAGQAVRHRMELARESVAALLNCRGRDIVFTSGGSEATNMTMRSLADQHPSRRVMVSTRAEHSATRETIEALAATRGVEPVWLPLTKDGVADVDALRDLLRARGDEILLVSVMWANNEVGVISPIDEIGALCREHGVLFHTDAVQAIGKLPIDLAASPVDFASLAAHKFQGPKGIGALYIRRGLKLAPQITGGPHERDRRGGTENTPGIVGFGVACDLAGEWLADPSKLDAQAGLRDHLQMNLTERFPDAVVHGRDAPRLWTTLNIGFSRLEAEAILLGMSERGVYASAGAACSSGSLEPSPILLAMGVPPEVAHGSIRLSIARHTTREEIDAALPVIRDVVSRLRDAVEAVT